VTVSNEDREATDATSIPGYCPMGCGTTLFRASGGYITCRSLACPRPDAVSNLLHDRETEHLVTFDEQTFTVRHPLRERLDDQLLTCDLHTLCANLSGPPARLGTYRVRAGASGEAWGTWDLVEGGP
jgi:hypothetical protein